MKNEFTKKPQCCCNCSVTFGHHDIQNVWSVVVMEPVTWNNEYSYAMLCVSMYIYILYTSCIYLLHKKHPQIATLPWNWHPKKRTNRKWQRQQRLAPPTVMTWVVMAMPGGSWQICTITIDLFLGVSQAQLLSERDFPAEVDIDKLNLYMYSQGSRSPRYTGVGTLVWPQCLVHISGALLWKEPEIYPCLLQVKR